MACLPTHTPGELEFVLSLTTRQRAIGQCRGPLLRIAFWPYRVFVLEHVLDSKIASDLLWDGFCDDGCKELRFELCGAHWMDLASLCQVRADQYRRVDWSAQAGQLLRDVCQAAGWDEKEILNMIVWQRERLT